MLCVSPESSYSAASSLGGKIKETLGKIILAMSGKVSSRGFIVIEGCLEREVCNKLLG